LIQTISYEWFAQTNGASRVFSTSLKDIYALALDGNVELYTGSDASEINPDAIKNSSVKIILVDQYKREYLVFEDSISRSTGLEQPNTRFSERCQETCILPLVSVFSLRVEVTGSGKLEIEKFHYADKPVAGDPDALRARQNAKIIEQLNQQDLGWVAGETSVSNLTYAEKKRLLGVAEGPQVLDLQGFEYYRGGVFELQSNSTDSRTLSVQANGSLVKNFTWGNRHGENWITSVKNQASCGSCWAFAATGATEAVTNLYYNQHLDLDLAEQDALSCSHAGNCEEGGFAYQALDYFHTTGIVDESCFPYTATDQSCRKKCLSPSIQIDGKISF